MNKLTDFEKGKLKTCQLLVKWLYSQKVISLSISQDQSKNKMLRVAKSGEVTAYGKAYGRIRSIIKEMEIEHNVKELK